MAANRNIHLTKKPSPRRTEIPNSPAISCTRSLLKHPSYESLTTPPNELANTTGELRVDDAHSRRLLSSNRRAELGGRGSLNEV